jgi:hypothetical protein
VVQVQAKKKKKKKGGDLWDIGYYWALGFGFGTS